MPDASRLRVHGHGGVEVELVAAYLFDLRHAYNALSVFEAVTVGLQRAAREFPFVPYPYVLSFGWPVASRRTMRHLREWPPTNEELSSLVPNSQQLVLSGVRLGSPGFWEFLGKLNPLEVIRQYLNDRHERRKDKEYRESAEKRRLLLENLKLENEVISGRVKLARDLGASDQDLAPLLNELVYRPLTALDRYQDKGVIECAELPPSPQDQRPR